MTALRLLLVVAVHGKIYVHGMDVKNAFLYCKLDPEIYIQLPEGYIDKTNPHYVCKLHRADYGLKQCVRLICSLGGYVGTGFGQGLTPRQICDVRYGYLSSRRFSDCRID